MTDEQFNAIIERLDKIIRLMDNRKPQDAILQERGVPVHYKALINELPPAPPERPGYYDPTKQD